MLGDAGSIASLVGVAVSSGGLIFAIVQLLKLKGETRAARKAAEAARNAVRRELASADLIRLEERIEELKARHRERDRDACLNTYRAIRYILQEIRRRHPGLSPEGRSNMQGAITLIGNMETDVESGADQIPEEKSQKFNQLLISMQSELIPQLEDQLRKSV